MKGKISTRRIVVTALFTAICFVGTQLKIELPLGGGTDTMIHLGTTAIFIGLDAGISAGIGCALFDLMSSKHVVHGQYNSYNKRIDRIYSRENLFF